MTRLDRIIEKPHRIALWTFTSIIVASALVSIFSTPNGLPDDKGGDSSKGKSKTSKAKDVEKWSRTELFDYLRQKHIYPDVDLPREELILLAKAAIEATN